MSNSVAVQQKRFVRLAPSNNASTFGPTGAQPIIRFSISDIQGLALLKDARLNFKFRADRAGALPPPNTTTGIVQGDDVNVDESVSLCSVIDQVIISSRRFGNTIEQVVNLGRLESAYYRSKFSPKMQASNQYNLSGSSGRGRFNRYNGQFSSSTTLADLRSLMERKATLINSRDCSIPFHAGVFLQDRPLDLSAVGGLEIACYLSKPEQIYFGTGNNPPTSASTYYLTNVSLTLPILYKSSQMIQATPPEQVLEFLNWTSLYSVLDSTVSSIAHRLYLSGLVAGIHNMLPTNQINNVSWNQYALKNPVLQRLTFLKDGQRNPLEKTTIVQEDLYTTGQSIATNQNVSTTYPEIINDYMASWGPTKDQTYSQVMPENLKGVSNRSGVFGIGCNYSPDSAGINVNGVLGMDIQSKIFDQTTGNDTPYAIYSFYLARQAYVTTPMGMKAL
jgi:hypothetical protein